MPAAAGSIALLPHGVAHRLCAGQVLLDLAQTVKELMENSLDASANIIEVRPSSSGLACIDVLDNGSGVPPQYHASLALRHATSKLSCFEDLASGGSCSCRQRPKFAGWEMRVAAGSAVTAWLELTFLKYVV